MIVPAFLGGESTVVAGLRALSPIAWLMGVGGAVLLLFLRDDRSLSTKSTGARTPAAVSLHPQPVRARYREQRPLQRPATDPLQAYEDTEIFFEDSGRPV